MTQSGREGIQTGVTAMAPLHHGRPGPSAELSPTRAPGWPCQSRVTHPKWPTCHPTPSLLATECKQRKPLTGSPKSAMDLDGTTRGRLLHLGLGSLRPDCRSTHRGTSTVLVPAMPAGYPRSSQSLPLPKRPLRYDLFPGLNGGGHRLCSELLEARSSPCRWTGHRFWSQNP